MCTNLQQLKLSELHLLHTYANLTHFLNELEKEHAVVTPRLRKINKVIS